MIYVFRGIYLDLESITAIKIFPCDAEGYYDNTVPLAQIVNAEYVKVKIYFAGCLKPVFELTIENNDFTTKEIQDFLSAYMEAFEE